MQRIRMLFDVGERRLLPGTAHMPSNSAGLGHAEVMATDDGRPILVAGRYVRWDHPQFDPAAPRCACAGCD